MKNVLLFFILLFIGAGCSLLEYNPDKYELWQYESFIAYIFNGSAKLELSPDPLNVKPVECKCDKNHTVLTGDSLLRIKCPCGTSCKCHQNDVEVVSDDCNKPIQRQVLYFGQNSCPPCREVKNKTFPELTKMNPPWKIGESNKDFIKTHEWTPELGEEFNVSSLPTFILIVDKVEVGRHIGYLNHIQLSNFYYTGVVK